MLSFTHRSQTWRLACRSELWNLSPLIISTNKYSIPTQCHKKLNYIPFDNVLHNYNIRHSSNIPMASDPTAPKENVNLYSLEAKVESVQSIEAENVSVDAKKLRKKQKKEAKLAEIRQLRTEALLKRDKKWQYGPYQDMIDDSDELEDDPQKLWSEVAPNAIPESEDAIDDPFDIEDTKHQRLQSMEEYRRSDDDSDTELPSLSFGFSFDSLGVDSVYLSELSKMGIRIPSAIQKKVIPTLMQKMGLLPIDNNASLQKRLKKHVSELTMFGDRTGTGKTLAYLLPILQAIKRDELTIPLRISRPRAVILAPTRELCVQIRSVIRQLSFGNPVSSCVLMAGENMRLQKKRLNAGVDIVVGTPNRIKQHLNRNKDFFLTDCRYVVLDEGDVLMNDGFWDDEVKEILSRSGCINVDFMGNVETPKLKAHRKQMQIIVTSATLTERDANKFCLELGLDPNVNIISGDSLHCILPNMNLFFWKCTKQDKAETLRNVLRAEQIAYNRALRDKYNETRDDSLLSYKLERGNPHLPQQTIIFCRTRGTAASVGYTLEHYGFKHEMFFGTHSPFLRKEKYERFLSGDVSILVATDAAMRGLDTTNVNHVILFDFPTNARVFLHRVGRTGRINTNVTSGKGGTIVDQSASKVTALIPKRDSFLAAAFLTALNEGEPLMSVNLAKVRYRMVPHLKLKTAAKEGFHRNLVPFEHMAVRLMTAQERAELKAFKKRHRHRSEREMRRLVKERVILDKPRLWWYRGQKRSRVPFYGIQNRIVKRLKRMTEEDRRGKLLKQFTTPRNELDNRQRRKANVKL